MTTNVLINNSSIQYGETSIITVSKLTNLTITPSDSVINIQTNLASILITVKPTISTLYNITGYDILNNFLYFNETIYVTPIISASSNYTVYGKPVTLTAVGSQTYKWSPATYLNTVYGQSVICTPLKSITYTVQSTDPFNNVNISYITINVDSHLVFTPNNPTVYEGNILKIGVQLINGPKGQNDITYIWTPTNTVYLEKKCSNCKYGADLVLHPIQSVEYVVSAYENKNVLITSSSVFITTIPKTAQILDLDILPHRLVMPIISRNTKELQRELVKDPKLSKRIINFYYISIQTAYQMEWTDKNGAPLRIPWVSFYMVVNSINTMIISFEQQWRLYQYININTRQGSSNLYFLINTINQLFLESTMVPKPWLVPDVCLFNNNDENNENIVIEPLIDDYGTNENNNVYEPIVIKESVIKEPVIKNTKPKPIVKEPAIIKDTKPKPIATVKEPVIKNTKPKPIVKEPAIIKDTKPKPIATAKEPVNNSSTKKLANEAASSLISSIMSKFDADKKEKDLTKDLTKDLAKEAAIRLSTANSLISSMTSKFDSDKSKFVITGLKYNKITLPNKQILIQIIGGTGSITFKNIYSDIILFVGGGGGSGGKGIAGGSGGGGGFYYNSSYKVINHMKYDIVVAKTQNVYNKDGYNSIFGDIVAEGGRGGGNGTHFVGGLGGSGGQGGLGGGLAILDNLDSSYQYKGMDGVSGNPSMTSYGNNGLTNPLSILPNYGSSGGGGSNTNYGTKGGVNAGNGGCNGAANFGRGGDAKNNYGGGGGGGGGGKDNVGGNGGSGLITIQFC